METSERSGGPLTRLKTNRRTSPLESTTSSSSGEHINRDVDEIVGDESEALGDNAESVNEMEVIPHSNHELGTKTAILLLLIIF